MSAAVNSLARTTVLDAVADTAESTCGLKAATVDNAAIETMLRRGRRWRVPAGMKLPQLSLRELFLIVVIAAVGCGWWVNRAGLRQQLREANEKFEDASKQMMRRLTYR